MANVICSRCGNVAQRTGNFQKYCRPCSETANAEFVEKQRQKRLLRSPEALKKKYSALVAIGAGISGKSNQSITELWHTRNVNTAWLVRVNLPFTYSASKNAVHAVGRGGHIFNRSKSNAFRDQLVMLLRSALIGTKIFNNKVWVNIFVQKPDHKGDAVNVIDVVCDAVKVAIKLDDRWFSIRRLDWEVQKNDPQIFVGVSQEHALDAQICSYCGRLLPFDHFRKNTAMAVGVGRECRECLTTFSSFQKNKPA